MTAGTGLIRTPEELQAVMGTPYVVSDPQWAAISADLEPGVVIAGAGSGKTELMAARVVYLVGNGLVRPEQVLGLTFTTKAAAELRQRIRRFLQVAADRWGGAQVAEDAEVLEPTVATYNAYAAGLLREHGLLIGHEPDTRVLADASRHQLAARAVAAHRGSVRLLSDSPPHVIGWLLGLEGQLSEHLLATDDLRAHDDALMPRVQEALAAGPKGKLGDVVAALEKRRELLGLVDDYRALKARLGVMDFSDQIMLAARLVAEHPAVGRSERDAFRVVLLDEYQDTSVAQAQLLAGVFSGPDGDGLGHPVTAVGDPNQAIYGWRGASVSNILRFGEQFPTRHGTARTFPLVVNRRSDERILQVANRLAAPLYEKHPQLTPLSAKPGAEPGTVDVVVHETYAEELDWLAHDVAAAHETGTPWREIGVLTRDNAHAADVFDALSAADIPVEIVGLNGLLRLPEVAEVVAMLTVIGDIGANAEILHLLSGPRWAIGPRDLALLGRRARDLAGQRRSDEEPADLDTALARAVAGADPADLVALSDAVDDPGEAPDFPYSDSGRERLLLFSRELRRLRALAGEPLLDLVRRIIEVTGIDVELASSVSPAAQARRDNLDRFVKAVAEFQAVDGNVSLPALLSYLTAEDELGTGLDVATPTLADSVKLLTVHRAKGLEYDVVILPGVCEKKFPHGTLRSQWPRGQAVVPIPLRGDALDLPTWRTVSAKGLEEFIDDAREHQAEEELRLGYVALTRARHRLVVSSYVWGEGVVRPTGPSPYQRTVREAMATWGAEPLAWREPPEAGTPNPTVPRRHAVTWPVTERGAEVLRRQAAAELVDRELAEPTLEVDDPAVPAELTAVWDAEIDRLLAEARRDLGTAVEVPMPASLSVTALARLRDDPHGLARELARPLPRKPSAAARFGTRFHAWVESRSGQQALLDTDDLAGRYDVDVAGEEELAALIEAFERGPFAERPPVAVEQPFAVVLGGQVVRGRIDAVYADGEPSEPGRYLVVDWKTGGRASADPLQLALYRLAWAELRGVPVDAVRAAFYLVRTGELVEPAALPDRDALTGLLAGGGT